MASSQAQVSRELRRTIREMVDEGRSNSAIYRYVQENYGDRQIAIPRQGWFYRISYGAPFFLIGLISVIALGFAWSWSDGEHDSDGSDDDPDDSKRKKIQNLASDGGPLK